ncbi:MAG TPA: hypothetical protein VM735_11125 [Candidatus Kapabacteria bacterium]|nr:hypothetical protein [Candidatus Kapabacteria bacterium]
MLVILRIIFTSAFFYCVLQARDNAQNNLVGGDITNAFWVGTGVLLAIACALVWAPFIGEKVADPISGGLVNSEPIDRKNRLFQVVRWLEKKERAPLLIRLLCFVEGVRRPWLPAAFYTGLNHSKPGSWFEKIYAKEVFRFNNVENCIRALAALQRHGIDPLPHENPDVNAILLSLERGASPGPDLVQVAPAPPPPTLQRNKRIRLGNS